MSKNQHGLARGLTNYGDMDFSLYLRRANAASMGYGKEILGKTVVGIGDTGSGFNNCHRHMPELIEAVKRGVLMAGGLPIISNDLIGRDVPESNINDVPKSHEYGYGGDDQCATNGRCRLNWRMRQNFACTANGSC